MIIWQFLKLNQNTGEVIDTDALEQKDVMDDFLYITNDMHNKIIGDPKIGGFIVFSDEGQSSTLIYIKLGAIE